jgi:predicted amidohydrolase
MRLVLTQPRLAFDSAADNVGVVERILAPYSGQLAEDDIIVLPEHFDLRPSRAAYETTIAELSRRFGCHVVGGSHHEDRDGQRVNSGVVANPSGDLIAHYEKLRPYATERSYVKQGEAFGEVRIGGHPVLILICADFWFSDVFYRARELPDLVLVPSLSVSRKPSPDYSRALWNHLAVARAYEFGAYVGVSDWAHAEGWPHPAPSGVGGLADPTTADPLTLYQPITGEARMYDIDWVALEAFRQDRMSRGFFWKSPVREP